MKGAGTLRQQREDGMSVGSLGQGHQEKGKARERRVEQEKEANRTKQITGRREHTHEDSILMRMNSVGG